MQVRNNQNKSRDSPPWYITVIYQYHGSGGGGSHIDVGADSVSVLAGEASCLGLYLQNG